MPTPADAQTGTNSPREALLERWLDALLPVIPGQGWTPAALAQAANLAGLDAADRAFAAPSGVDDLVAAFLARGDRAMAQAIATTDMAAMRVRERVAFAVMAWLDAFEPHREAMRRAIGRAGLPWRAMHALERTWSLADTVWTGAGDTATDYNRYTKRGLLSLILPPVVLYWLDQPDREAVRGFLDRRVSDAMRVGQSAGRLLAALGLKRKKD